MASSEPLGVADKGIFSDLDDKVQLTLPAGLSADRVTARVDSKHGLLVLSIDGYPRKAYPLGGNAALDVGKVHLALRAADRDELRPLLAEARLSEGAADHDHDGDVPRTIGVCTDVIIRAVRNAGLDLQKELHEDIRRAKAAYPMVKGTGDANIDQRRVGTLLPYFKRHWEKHTPKLDDPKDPYRPGDVILMDTFPSRSGPDHIGIISDRTDDQGLPLVINNWTDGTVTSEMDLLTFVPVMYRFRLVP